MNENTEITKVPGKGAGVASLVLGILSIVGIFTGVGSILSLVFGIIGICLAGKARKIGFDAGVRTAGFVTSLIGLIISAIIVLFVLLIGGALVGGAFAFLA